MRQTINRIALTYLFVLFFFLISVKACQAKPIAVELTWNFGQAGWSEIKIESGTYLLECGETERSLASGETIQVGWGGWAPIWRINHEDFRIFRSPELTLQNKEKGSFQITMPEGQHYSYRGGVKLNWQDGHWRLINLVDGEDYLKGVVPIEMSNRWAGDGLEALKAQAIAARTYMVRRINSGKLLTDSPDIDQAYLGKAVEGQASQAVEATRGQILVDATTKKPIDALYSAHDGGYTEDPKNVWGNSDNHFSAHPDPFSNGVGGAENSWHFIISAPALGNTFGLGPVRKIELDKFPSGRVQRVRMEDWNGNKKSVSGRNFVKTFYPFGRPIQTEAFLGSLFVAQRVETGQPECFKGFKYFLKKGENGNTVSSESDKGPILGKIISSNDGIAATGQPYGEFIFWGRGWGHGVGMSQWGAYHMAQLGYTYKDILSFYYDRAIIITTKY